MKQHYPLDPVSGIENPSLPWANGNPATGTNGSFPPFGLFVDPQAEILGAQRAGGLSDSADGSDTAQLAQGISRGTWLGTIGQPANANDLVTALPGSIIWPKLLIGMEFAGVISAPNTGPMTVTLTGFGTLPGKLNLIGRAGGALQPGDLAANAPFKFRYDGTQFRVAGGVASDIALSPYAGSRGAVPITTTQTWTVPAGVYYLKRVRLWGGGGGGGGSIGSGSGGSGGAGSGYSEKYNIPVTPNQQIAITVGAAGPGGGTVNGTTGGTTSFGSIFSATGGGYGSAGNGGIQNTTAGFGGQGMGGDLNYTGGNGSYAYSVAGVAASGIGGSAPFGGASPTPNFSSAGNSGNGPGGGGNGGSQGGAGGAGAAGLVIIEY